ncbi:MAG: ASCH domain-containing protein [Calothrix sp. FI2-JRJ7]|jgi:hypothetical protein|nr:ASCH domain-containing protein [Calothrix sp. FI2-JRJ7]
MKIITLHQPWAHLIAIGYKHYETRSWHTKYRGALAIHSAKRPVSLEELARISNESAGTLDLNFLTALNYEYGKIVVVAELTDCLAMVDKHHPGRLDSTIKVSSVSALEKACGDWRAGRYAWELKDIKKLDAPIPYKGRQGLMNVDGATAALLSKSCG